MDGDLRRRALATALSTRLAEVLQLLRADERPSMADVEATDDPEEALRLVMVRLWPRAARGDATDAEVRELLERLASLEADARGEDLRFLDAWNNAFEALTRRPNVAPEGFLAAYAGLLRHHVERLGR